MQTKSETRWRNLTKILEEPNQPETTEYSSGTKSTESSASGASAFTVHEVLIDLESKCQNCNSYVHLAIKCI